MANEQNLIPKDSNQNREEAKKNGRKGGIESGKARRARRTFKELFLHLANTQITNKNDLSNGKLFKSLKALFPDIDEKEFTHQTAMYVALLKTAFKGGKGSVQAFNSIRDTMGEKPTDKVEQINTNLQINDKEVINDVISKLKNI